MTSSKKNEQRDLFRGALEMMVLGSLMREPMHGYALVQHIKQRSNDLLQVEEGSLYSRIAAIAKGRPGKSAVEWEISGLQAQGAHLHQITPKGKKHLEREVFSFEQMLEGITRVLAPSES